MPDMEYWGEEAGYSRSGSSELLARFCFTERAAQGRWKYPAVSIDIVHLHGPACLVFPARPTEMMHEINAGGK